MCDKEQLTYNKGMKILISNAGLVIEVARNRCIIRGEKGFRSPVMAEAFFFSSHFFSPYSEDHKPTLDDEKIIREVISANNIFRMPVPYEKYHLFTEEEYGKLDVETKKHVLFLEISDGTVVYMPWREPRQ